MFISTREMLGQVKDSSTLAKEIIARSYGPDCDWSKILADLSSNSTLSELGLDIFSDRALQHIASALNSQQQQKAGPSGDHARQ